MTPDEQTNNQAPTSAPETTEAPATKTSAITVKDLLIPGSIALAGLFIGIGMYFGGVKESGDIPLVAETPEQNSQKSLQALVQEAGVSLGDVEECVNSGEVSDLVQEDVDNAIATGGRGTPWSVVIGPSGKTYPLNGAQPLAAINQILELARSEGASPAVEGEDTTDQVAPVTEADHIKGSLDAPIKIVEYSDYDCPFCSRFHDSMNQVVEQNDDVAWVYRHFPLDQLHPNARTIAQISECIAEAEGNDAFWTFTDGYFAL